MRSDRQWYQYLRTGNAESEEKIGSGNMSSYGSTDYQPFASHYADSTFDIGTHGSNHILLIVFGGEGWFFVNDSMVGKLKLDTNSVSGNVMATSGHFFSDETEGSITRFEDFTVWAP